MKAINCFLKALFPSSAATQPQEMHTSKTSGCAVHMPRWQWPVFSWLQLPTDLRTARTAAGWQSREVQAVQRGSTGRTGSSLHATELPMSLFHYLVRCLSTFFFFLTSPCFPRITVSNACIHNAFSFVTFLLLFRKHKKMEGINIKATVNLKNKTKGKSGYKIIGFRQCKLKLE